MRRKASGAPRNSTEFDFRKDMDQEVIWSIGACTLLWNTIEATTEVSFALALELPSPLWVSVTSRINGMEGRIEIIKEAARKHFKMPPKVYDPIAATLGAIQEHKKYRDALIHVRIINPTDSVAPSFLQRGDEWEVLVTRDAVKALTSRLEHLKDESEDILLIFHHTKIWNQLKPTMSNFAAKQRSVEQDLSRFLAQLRQRQAKRSKLPPLPEFPDEPADPKNRDHQEPDRKADS
jgi:hypothetical protein